MVMKGYAKAHNHKGGYEKWVHDEFKNVYKAIEDIEGADTTELTSAVEALQTAVGKATGQGAGGLAKDVADIKAAIGDAETADTILYRLAALETEDTTESEPSG